MVCRACYRTVLTPSELECISLLADGFGFDEIAAKRGTTLSGVSAALLRARIRRGAVTNAHLVAMLMRDGTLE